MKNFKFFMFFIFLMISAFASAKTNRFCKTKFGNTAFVRFVPLEAVGKIAVEDGIHGARISESKPVISPNGFVCVAWPDEKTQKCKKGLTFDDKTLEKPYCISEIISLLKLCPKEILDYSKIVSSDICTKK